VEPESCGDDTGGVDSANTDDEHDSGNEHNHNEHEADKHDGASSSSEDGLQGHTRSQHQDPSFPNLPTDSATLGSLLNSQPPIASTLSGTALALSQKTLHGYFQSPQQCQPRHSTQTLPPIPSLKRKPSPTTTEVNTPNPKRPRQQGTSKSAQFEAKSRAAADKGTYDPQKFDKFMLKIRSLDPNAEFLINNNPRIVRHSKCAGAVHMKATNNTTAFTKHLERCKGPTKKRAPIANTDKNCLTRFLNHERSTPSTAHIIPTSSVAHITPLSNASLPCPGLTPECDERIWTYLVRSQAAGGGSRPHHVIAQDLFGKTFKDLRPGQRKKVLRVEATEFRWINYREQQLVLSALCLKESPSQHEPAQPCRECIALSKWRIFKNALNRDLPKQGNLKYTPHAYRAKTSSEQCAKMVGVHEIFQKATAVS
jgi:hypothetical protein